MHKLTLIIALLLGSLAFAQPGKGHGNGGHSEKNTKNESFGSKNNSNQADQKQNGNKGGPGKQGGSNNQGKNSFKDKGANGGNGNHDLKQNNNRNKPEFNQNKDNGNHQDKSHKINYPTNKDKNHSDVNRYDKGHPNFGYIYTNKHGYYSHSNYGKWRSEKAKNKHNHYHPVYEYQAIEGFNFIILRNQFLYTETNYKINLLRVRLADRRKAGKITAIEFDKNMRTIRILEKRRATLEVNIVL